MKKNWDTQQRDQLYCNKPEYEFKLKYWDK